MHTAPRRWSACSGEYGQAYVCCLSTGLLRWNSQIYTPKAALNDLKALAPAVNKVLHRNTNVLIDDLAVTLRGCVVAEHAHRADDLHARCVRGDNDDALLPVLVRVLWVALTEHEVDHTSGIACAADVPARHNSDKF